MKNSLLEKPAVCGIVNPLISFIKPSCEHGLSLVTPFSNHSPTSITQNQTLVTPDHTAVKLPTHTCLSLKQALVFEYLERIVSRQTSYNSIAVALGLSKPAARSAVSGLVTKKYLMERVAIKTGAFQGFAYKIDGEKCHCFLAEGGSSNPIYLASYCTITPPTHTVCESSDPIHTHSSSVCNLESNLTTTTVNLNDPEMLWWEQKGLTAKHIKTWTGEFDINPESLVQSLRSAKFDVVENEVKANGKLIENPLNWIYAILKKSSIYQRPKNYKSLVEIRAAELEDQQRRDEIARKKIWEAEIEVEFRGLMNDQKSPLYQELFCCLNDYAKDNQAVLEISMKELFKEKYPMVQYRSN